MQRRRRLNACKRLGSLRTTFDFGRPAAADHPPQCFGGYRRPRTPSAIGDRGQGRSAHVDIPVSQQVIQLFERTLLGAHAEVVHRLGLKLGVPFIRKQPFRERPHGGIAQLGKQMKRSGLHARSAALGQIVERQRDGRGRLALQHGERVLMRSMFGCVVSLPSAEPASIR